MLATGEVYHDNGGYSFTRPDPDKQTRRNALSTTSKGGEFA